MVVRVPAQMSCYCQGTAGSCHRYHTVVRALLVVATDVILLSGYYWQLRHWPRRCQGTADSCLVILVQL